MSTHRLSRKDFLKTMGLAAASMGIPSLDVSALPRAAKGAGERPNIIFMMADDLGYADVGCYGQKLIRTPHIDRLAEEGLKFTQVYAGSTVCAPCRSVLMTGQHTGHTTVRGNFGKTKEEAAGGRNKGSRIPLKAEDVTVAMVLKKAGYSTCITGKWGLGEPETTGIPNRKGFDEWFGYLNQANAHTYYPPYLWKNEEKVILKGNEGEKKQDYTHDMISDFALDFIENQKKDRPFFLYLPWCIPHSTFELPSIKPYENEAWEKSEKTFAAMVTRMDRDVGRIMALLKKKGMDENTLVFFCSDNGAAKRWDGRFDSSGPLRGQKRDMYEGGIRVPMLVRWPGKVPAGEESEQVWYFADVLPTFAALAGAKAPKNIDGINVLPALLGEEQKELRERYLYWEFYEGAYKQAVRTGDWKAVKNGVEKDWELYDLSKDLGEENDIAQDNQKILRNIKKYIRKNRSDSLYWPIPELKAAGKK